MRPLTSLVSGRRPACRWWLLPRFRGGCSPLPPLTWRAVSGPLLGRKWTVKTVLLLLLASDLPVHTAPEGRPLGRRPCDCCVDLVAAVREACLPDCLDLLPSVMIYYCLGNEPHLALDCPHFNALRTKYETKLRLKMTFVLLCSNHQVCWRPIYTVCSVHGMHAFTLPVDLCPAGGPPRATAASIRCPLGFGSPFCGLFFSHTLIVSC